jgi:hypothetical protein
VAEADPEQRLALRVRLTNDLAERLDPGLVVRCVVLAARDDKTIELVDVGRQLACIAG